MAKGEVAFPIVTSYDNGYGVQVDDVQPGLTKLEYAAIHILAGLYANNQYSVESLPKIAAKQAKALFQELEKAGE